MNHWNTDEERDLDELTPEELQACLAHLEEELAKLDAREPADETSAAYDDWADEHEELEDWIDDVKDRLDDLPA